MLRYLIFSDSHGRLEPMAAICRACPADGVIHLGDHETDALRLREQFPDLPVCFVRGNCDYGGSSPLVLNVKLGGVPFYLTHGHVWNVKYGHEAAIAAARKSGARVLLFGHTHSPLLEEWPDLLVMNPGALRSGDYGVIEIENGKPKGVLRTYDQGRNLP